MASEATEERARELFAALSSSSVAVLEETARLVERERTLGRLTPDKYRSLRAQLVALGWRAP